MTTDTLGIWWKRLKPAECDEVKEHFIECWQAATLAERERCLNCYSPDDTVTDYQDKIRSGE